MEGNETKRRRRPLSYRSCSSFQDFPDLISVDVSSRDFETCPPALPLFDDSSVSDESTEHDFFARDSNSKLMNIFERVQEHAPRLINLRPRPSNFVLSDS
jgi:hypothetical protein